MSNTLPEGWIRVVPPWIEDDNGPVAVSGANANTFAWAVPSWWTAESFTEFRQPYLPEQTAVLLRFMRSLTATGAKYSTRYANFSWGSTGPTYQWLWDNAPNLRLQLLDIPRRVPSPFESFNARIHDHRNMEEWSKWRDAEQAKLRGEVGEPPTEERVCTPVCVHEALTDLENWQLDHEQQLTNIRNQIADLHTMLEHFCEVKMKQQRLP